MSHTITRADPLVHVGVKIAANADALFAASRHMLQLQVGELGAAVSRFPLFLSRVTDKSDWALSALASFEPGKNLFVTDGVYEPGFAPAAVQTHPFVLLNGDGDAGGPVIGFDESAESVSTTSGQALFSSGGDPSLFLKSIEARLRDGLAAAAQTRAFLHDLERLELILPITISLQCAGGETFRIGGLNTINEDRLKSMRGAALDELHEKGYLAPIYALLLSIGQLNPLMIRHNASTSLINIEQIKLEVARDIQAL